MANTFSPFGFRSFGHGDGSAPTMGLTKGTILSSYATAIYTGDTVGISSASGFEGTLSAVFSSSTHQLVGVFAGCEYYNPNVQRQVWSPYFPGSVGSSSPCIGYYISDPEMTYIVQASTGTAVGSSLIGYNIGVTAGTGNTTTGFSGAYVNSSQVGASSSYPWKVVDSYVNYGPPGVNGASTDAGGYLVVQPNGWQRNTVTTTGVTT